MYAIGFLPTENFFFFFVILLQGFVFLLAYWNRYVQYYNFPSWTFSVWAYLCFLFHRMLKEHWWSTPTLSTGNAIQQHRQHFWEYSDTKVEMKRGEIKSIYVVLLESLHFSILWLTLKFRDGRCRLWRCWVLVVVNLTSRLEQMVSPELLLLIVSIVEWRVLKTSHKFVCVIFFFLLFLKNWSARHFGLYLECQLGSKKSQAKKKKKKHYTTNLHLFMQCWNE